MKFYDPYLFELRDITINPNSTDPIWEQIARVLNAQVSRKAIKVGEYTWSIRNLARFNKVSATTIAKAYKVLEEKGIIEGVPQKGYRIGKEVHNFKNKNLDSKINDLVIAGKQLRMTKEEILNLVSKKL